MAMINCPECEKPISDQAPSCPNCGMMMAPREVMNGWVYILSNEEMPGLVKVGYTDRDPVGRAKELSSTTSVPTPFVVEYGALVKDPVKGEKEVHEILAVQRVNEDREFFRCSVDEAIAATRKVLSDGILFEGSCISPNTEEEIKSEISFPLISLIYCLKGDGKLTYHEINLLGEWLEANPDAYKLWPGTKLVEPLKEFHEDGVLSEDELKLMSKLLQEIQIQWNEKFKWHESKDSETEASAEESNVEYEALRQRLEKITIEQRGLNISDQSGPPAEKKDWLTALEKRDKNLTSQLPVQAPDQPAAQYEPTPEGKDWTTTLILSLLLGAFGFDRFYLGYTGLGYVKLLTCGGLGVWALYDLIMIATNKMTDSNGNPLLKH